MRSFIEKLLKEHYNYLKLFVIIGFTCTAFDYLLYKSFLNVLDINRAKFFATLAAVFLNYYLNSKFNFSQLLCFNIKTGLQYIFLYIILIEIHVAINQKLYSIYSNIEVAFVFAMSFSVFINYLSVYFFCKFLGKKKNNKIST